MTTNQEALESIAQIKNMMERSSKFLSLSGLSGVFAGIYALVGVFFAHRLLKTDYQESNSVFYHPQMEVIIQLILIFGLVLLLSLVTAFFFTKKKAKRTGLNMWDGVAKKMFINFVLPLFVGLMVSLMLLFVHKIFQIVPAVTLMFYGLGLVNASKYSFDELRFLGYIQIILGLVAFYFLSYGLVFWAIGFGVLHIIYGFYMYNKHH